MAFRVLIPQDVRGEGKEYLTQRGYEIKMGSGTTVDAIRRDVVDCDAILARTAPFPAEVLEAGKNLKVIARHGIGVDNVDVERAAELGIWVTNAPESNSNTVAEHALLLILATARKLIPISRVFDAGEFEVRNRELGTDLAEKTLGIVGVGKIGRLVAKKATGLDMRCIGYDPVLAPDEYPAGIAAAPWDEVFSRADFVTLHIPATPRTRNIVGETEFRLMRRSAILINTARGEVVDEAALIAALRENRIGGAGLDVFQTEPPDRDNPLLSMANVVATPHNAAHTVESMGRMALHAAMGIDDVLSGRTPRWPVNDPTITRQ
ncbi:MAG: hydroxyacid dehydrogenase [Spirochaetales bacterium]|nr:hydroxyacid dehydrogenase [Spirochaetales bacterium]